MIGLVLFLALFAAAGGPIPAAAAVGAAPAADRDTVYLLPEVRVERERALSEARRRLPTAFVTELPAARSQHALETVSEVLARAAGVHVQQYGGLGSFSTVSLRGAPPGQVSVFLDGAPLTSAAHGVVNLADLPATAVERVEVYRGLAPLGLGVATPGGAINLVTVASPGPLEASVTGGSFDTWEGRATAGARSGRLGALLHAGYQGSHGDFRYANDNGTPLNPADDRTSIRLNNRFDAATALATLTLDAGPALRLTAREDLFHKAQGVPGLGAVPARHPRLSFLRSLTHLEAAHRGAGPRPDLRLRAAAERERSRFRDSAGELGLGRHDSDERIGGENADLELGWSRLPGGLALEAAGSLRAERARLADRAEGWPDPPASRRAGQGAMLGLQYRPLGERLVLHAARRWDRIADRLRSLGVAGVLQSSDVTRVLDAPQLGMRLAARPGLELRANWARAARAPDFLELFGNQGSVLGNPALRPESAENWDAGLSGARALGADVTATLEWAHFESRARDLVVYVQNSQSSVRAQNVSRARIRGEELTLRLAGPRGGSASGSLTWQSARDEGPAPAWHGKRLPQRPEWQGYLRLEQAGRRTRASAEVQWIGDNFLDPYNGQRVPARALVGASVSLAPFARGPRLTLEGKNLGDERASDVGGFPLPGRSLFAAVEFRLGPAESEAAAAGAKP